MWAETPGLLATQVQLEQRKTHGPVQLQRMGPVRRRVQRLPVAR